ncbi:MAG: thioredoxin domain-containing protein [Chloroflexi bacterium]|nr:thioredoxin domain-containing protein [Chloroflexota bacterium]
MIFTGLATMAVLLAACGTVGTDLTVAAGVDAGEVDSVQQVEIEANVSSSGSDPAEQDDAQSEVGTQADAQANTQDLPEIVLSDPHFRETEAGVFDRNTGQVQFLEFFAYWCLNCKALAPSVHGLQDIYGDEVNFVYLDIDKVTNAQLMNEYGFYYQPYILVFDEDGTIIQSWVGGGIDPLELQSAIELALNE